MSSLDPELERFLTPAAAPFAAEPSLPAERPDEAAGGAATSAPDPILEKFVRAALVSFARDLDDA